MGYNLALNVLDNRHEAVVFDVNWEAVERAAQAGAIGTASIAELVEKLTRPRIVWVTREWNNGPVIRSWLMELTEQAFAKDPGMKKLEGVVHSSGEGQWTVETVLELGTATPVIALSLMIRYRSLEEDTFSGKVVAAMRNEFGGHSVVAASSERRS